MKEYIVKADFITEGDELVLPNIVSELIRCKDCEDCTETELYDGQKWNYCKRLRCVVKDDDYCSWAEKKYPKIKSKVTE